MTRGRLRPEIEEAREGVETTLALVGNARVYLRLIRVQVTAAINSGDTRVLNEVLADLAKADRLLVKSQTMTRQE